MWCTSLSVDSRRTFSCSNSHLLTPEFLAKSISTASDRALTLSSHASLANILKILYKEETDHSVEWGYRLEADSISKRTIAKYLLSKPELIDIYCAKTNLIYTLEVAFHALCIPPDCLETSTHVQDHEMTCMAQCTVHENLLEWIHSHLKHDHFVDLHPWIVAKAACFHAYIREMYLDYITDIARECCIILSGRMPHQGDLDKSENENEDFDVIETIKDLMVRTRLLRLEEREINEIKGVIQEYMNVSGDCCGMYVKVWESFIEHIKINVN